MVPTQHLADAPSREAALLGLKNQTLTVFSSVWVHNLANGKAEAGGVLWLESSAAAQHGPACARPRRLCPLACGTVLIPVLFFTI